jgi:hypothetical protein
MMANFANSQCPGLGSISFSVVAAPEPTLTFPAFICNGQSATIAVNESFDSYLWSTGATTNSISVTQGGTYSVTVSNAAGCDGTASATLANNGNPQPNITGPTVICNNNPITLSAAGSFSSWEWSNGQTSQDIVVSTPGTYAVTVTDANGCTGTDDVVVVLGTNVQPDITSQPFICGQVTLNAGAGFATYTWSNGGSTQTINVQQNGNYTVTVTDAFGCTGTDEISVSIPLPTFVDLVGPASLCVGGTATLTASPGFNNYFWSNGVTGVNTISVTQPGQYSVTASDVNGCLSADGIFITANNIPPPQIVGNTVICPGGSTVLSLTENYPIILWSSGQTTQQITVTSVGTYSVTVTDANGCTASNSIAVTPGGPVNFPFTALPSGCGQFTLEVGPGYPSYLWSTGSTAQSIIVTQTGPYSVTVTDAGGCTGTIALTVVIPPPSLVQINTGQPLCAGGTTTLTASGGFVAYSWSNGANTATNIVSQSGTYTVTATDLSGCTSTATANVVTLPTPVPAVNQPSPICAGETATISVTNPIFQNYNWSNGGSGSSITVSSSGTYVVTVADAAGCTGTAATDLTVNPSPVAAASQLPYQCNGIAELSATPGFQSYSWSNGESNSNITVNQPGSFTVTVTGPGGCTTISSVVANIPPAPQVNINGQPVICEGTNTILAATPGFANYAWNTGQGGASISVIATGTYFVTVTDAFACTATNSFNVTAQPAPEPQITGPTQICAGGTAVFTAIGGNFSSYVWSNGSQASSISVSAPGNYGLTVTDDNGCSGSAFVDLSVGSSLNIVLNELPYQCNGEITLDAGAGFEVYTWSNGSSSQLTTVNANGNFSVTVTDATGCTGSATSFVSIPAQPQANISGPSQICEGESADLTASAGFANYLWSNGQQNPIITVATTDTYSVTVSDFDGCQATASFILAVNPSPQPIITGAATICQNSSTVLSVAGNFQTWAWSTGETMPEINASAAGNYSVTVTNASGCTGTDAFQVNVSTSLQPQISAQPYACNSQLTLDAGVGFLTYLWSNGGASQTTVVSQNGNYAVTVSDAGGCTGSAVFNASIPAQQQVAITGGTAFCTGGSSLLTASSGFQNYLWSNGTASAQTTVTQPGTYAVTATDANSCTSVATINVTVSSLAPPQILGSTTICNGASTVLSLSQNYPNILWSTGQAAQQITVSVVGTYAVTVSDVSACSATASVSLTTASSLSPQIAALPVACGLVSLDAGPGFASYLWSDGSATQSIPVSQNGNYAVTVSDAGGCTGTDVFFVLEVNGNLQPEISSEPLKCRVVTLDAGSGYASYVWSNGDDTQTIDVDQDGEYSVTITDAAGCTGADTFNVILPLPTFVELTVSGPLCPGGVITLTASAGFDAYIWSDGTTGVPSITVAQPGDYSVTAIDVNKCNSADGVLILDDFLPPPQILGSTTICNGSATLLALSDDYPNILWSTGQTTQQITVSAVGNYAVTVSDAGGCSATASVSVTASSSLSPQIAALPVTCGLVSLDAGPGFVSYLWSDGSATQSIPVSQNGNYAVTVSDAGGCTGTDVISVTLPTPIPVAITGNQTICTGGVSTLTATAGFQAYSWSNGAISAATTVTQPGQYSVTATDVNGCSSVAALTVIEDFILPPQILGSSIICNGNPTTLFLSAGYDNYLWSNGSTNSAITVATPGLVSVTVTNTNGCSGETSMDVTVGNNLNPQVVQVSNDCSGLVAIGVGNAYESYLWSNGGTNLVTLVDQTGTYFVTVTDANGCSGVGSIFAQVPQQFSVDISGNTAFCPGGATTLTATDGFQDYSWSNGATGAGITVSQAGNYTVTVSDINGCTGTAQVAVTVGSGAPPQIIGNNIICVGGSTVLSIANAANFTQFLWSNGSVAPQITALSASIYTVTATDLVGCTATGSIEVTEGNVLAPSISEGSYNCEGNLTLEAPDGFQSYTWSNGAGTPVITVSQDGSYFLTVTDASGCTGTASIFVAVPEDLVVVVQTPSTPICPGNTAQLSVPPGFQSYAWSSGETTNAIVIGTSDTYTVTVTDQYGCTAADAYVFNFAEAPEFDIIGNSLDCETAASELELDFMSLNGSPSFLWSNGATTATLSTAVPGIFAVTVTDGNGCTAVQSTEVSQSSSYESFADTIEFLPGQLVPLVPPAIGFQPVEITWSPTDILLDCDNCLTAQARAIDDVLVSFTAVSAAGCVQEGTFFLFFKDRVRPSVYAPNAFSPDSPFNPAFTLFGNELVVEIKYLRIFTRWGEQVVELKNFAPNDPSKGWDGRFRGELVDPGVFVWVAEVVYSNGSSEVLKGDITVIR